MFNDASGGLPTLASADLRPGDLLFCERPSLIQRLCTWVGDPWRHVGIVVERQGEIYMLEVGSPGFRARHLSEVTAAYTSLGVSQVEYSSGAARREAIRWAESWADRRYRYLYLALLLTGYAAIVRRYQLTHSSLAILPLRIGSRLVQGRGYGPICSIWVADALRAGDVDLTLPPIPRDFISPGDLWRGVSSDSRYLLDEPHRVAEAT